MSDISVDTRFAFQPLVNLHTGGIVGIEMFARPPQGDVRTALSLAARSGRLEKLDVAWAVAAAHHSSVHETRLPLHLNLLADTVIAEVEVLAPLHRALQRTGRRASETVLEINPSYAELETEPLLAGLRRLRHLGYRIALDGVGAGNYPLTVLAEAAPDLIKMDREVVDGLPGQSSCVAVLEALAHLAPRIGAQVVAEGVERPVQLAALRQCGVGIAQGNLLSAPSRRPLTYLPSSGMLEFRVSVPRASASGLPGARITDFAHPALSLPVSATADEVRTMLRDQPAMTSVVLVDEDNRPCYTLDRNRFLLAVSGTYGHALYARRQAARLGDPPRVLESESSALAALELMRSSEAHRMYDDIVVLDSAGRCSGVVRVGDLVRGVAEMHIEQAAALHPLTLLPGSDMIAKLVDRKIATAEVFAVSWLDVDDFGAVNDNGGFIAGDDLIRELGRVLTNAVRTAETASLAHLGGDDFLVVCDPSDVMPIGSAILDQPWEIEGQQVTLSLASLVCMPGTVTEHRDVSRMLARLRRHAKTMSGTSWLVGHTGSDQVDVLRGQVETAGGIDLAELSVGERALRSMDWIPTAKQCPG